MTLLWSHGPEPQSKIDICATPFGKKEHGQKHGCPPLGASPPRGMPHATAHRTLDVATATVCVCC